MTDLTKAFDSLSHDLLVAKLNLYGFSKLSLKMMTTLMIVSKEPDSTTVLVHVIYDVPQGSILEQLHQKIQDQINLDLKYR